MTTHTDPALEQSGNARRLASRLKISLQSVVADEVAIAITGALTVLIVIDATGSLRALLALAFVCYVPGRAVVANWPAAQARSQVALPVLLSVSIVTLISVIALWVHAWNPMAQFAVEAGASMAAIAFAFVQRARSGVRPNANRRPTIDGPR